MRLVDTDVLRVAVEEQGPAGGRPILLLHGWPDAPRGWGPVARRLQERGWRTIVPALRGSGATRFRSTETPRDGRGVALAGDALDLMDALGLHGVPVVGHDWGARVAYTVAAVAPEREARSPRSRFPISRGVSSPSRLSSYAKIGASTRATASLFAMQHGLLPEEGFVAGVAA